MQDNQDFNPWNIKDKGLAYQCYNDMQKINYKILQNTIHENMALMNDNLTNNVRAVQLMTKVNRPEEFFKSQLSLVIEQGERALEHGQNLFQVLENGLKEYRLYIEEMDVKTAMPFTKDDGKESKPNKNENVQDKKVNH